MKQPKIVTDVSYTVRGGGGECGRPGRAGRATPRPATHSRPVGRVPLAVSSSGYQQLAADEILHLLVPQTPLYPGSQLYVPVFVEQPRDSAPVSVVVLRCRARRGVRIAGIEETSRFCPRVLFTLT